MQVLTVITRKTQSKFYTPSLIERALEFQNDASWDIIWSIYGLLSKHNVCIISGGRLRRRSLVLAVAAAQVMTSRKKSTTEDSGISPRAAQPTHAQPTFKSTGLNHVLMCVSFHPSPNFFCDEADVIGPEQTVAGDSLKDTYFTSQVILFDCPAGIPYWKKKFHWNINFTVSLMANSLKLNSLLKNSQW